MQMEKSLHNFNETFAPLITFRMYVESL